MTKEEKKDIGILLLNSASRVLNVARICDSFSCDECPYYCQDCHKCIALLMARMVQKSKGGTE